MFWGGTRDQITLDFCIAAIRGLPPDMASVGLDAVPERAQIFQLLKDVHPFELQGAPEAVGTSSFVDSSPKADDDCLGESTSDMTYSDALIRFRSSMFSIYLFVVIRASTSPFFMTGACSS